MLRLQLVEQGGEDFPKVARLANEGDSAAHARASEVQKLLDHPGHSPRAVHHSLGDVLERVGDSGLEMRERNDDRVQGVSKVVAEGREKKLARPLLLAL